MSTAVSGNTDCGQHSHMQGHVEPQAAADVAGKLYEMGCYEVSMGDTIGVGTPASVAEMFKVCSPSVQRTMHFPLCMSPSDVVEGQLGNCRD